MPRKKKLLTDAEVAKLRDIEAYDHADKKRANNPPIGLAKKERVAEEMTKYAFDPHIDPTLDWAGKKEGVSFEVPASSIHIHESIKPSKILRAVQSIGDDTAEAQLSLFESPLERMRRRQASLEFYKHGVDWTNRLIAGDSLVIMNSLLEKEGMAGQVQMVYIDPPYGIKYGSNFQPFVGQRDVKDKKDEDLSQEPETIKAFRDTWELGIHSYLTYLRNRLLLARELLAETGSVFVQISDENVHRVRCICDEVFGADNFVSMVTFRKKLMPLGSNLLEEMADYIVWYSKNKETIKYHHLFEEYKVEGASRWTMVQLPDGTRRKLTSQEYNNHSLLPEGSDVFRLVSQRAPSFSAGNTFDYEFHGKVYHAPGCWITNKNGMDNLAKHNRFYPEGDNLSYTQFFSDFPFRKITNPWNDTAPAQDKQYVVQTNSNVIARCLLMTTAPGDLVLDITCGSGTTAFVAEQWGRRWITCDTSRVAIELAKERLMTATFDYYKLAHPEQGVGSGFIYKTVPHITLKSIANDEPPATETLYDRPEIDKTKVRISGPFTVESLPAPVVRPLDDGAFAADSMDLTAKQSDWRDELLATGILGKNGARLEFSRVESLSGTAFFQAEAETKEETPKRALICFGSETKVMDARYVDSALDEAEKYRPRPDYIIFAAFQFGPEASKMLDEMKWEGVTLLKVQMNTDLMTDDLKKKRASNESFWLVGQPDVELIRDKRSNKRYKVRVRGFDYYDVKTGKVVSGTDRNIAMWMLDTDYDGMIIEPHQVFFPMAGKKGGWTKISKTLKAEIDQEKIQQYAGNESLWFEAESNMQVAVKIIDDRGIESMRTIRINDEEDA